MPKLPTTRNLFVPAICLAALAVAGQARAASLDQVAQDVDVDIQGAWQAERYILKDGTEHPVAGLIFFTGNDWTVLFFVLDESGGGRAAAREKAAASR